MSKRIFVVSWILVLACVCVPSVFSGPGPVQSSADKLIVVQFNIAQQDMLTTCLATGTPIGSGVIITVEHLFKDDAELLAIGFAVKQPMDKVLTGCYTGGCSTIRFPMRLTKLGEEDDVAVLKADLRYVMNMMRNTPWTAREHRDIVALYALLVKGIPIATEELAIDDPVFFAGFPFGGPLVVDEGMFYTNSVDTLTCNGTAERGMSGGAMLNSKGAIVSFIANKLQGNGKNWVRGPAVRVVSKIR